MVLCTLYVMMKTLVLILFGFGYIDVGTFGLSVLCLVMVFMNVVMIMKACDENRQRDLNEFNVLNPRMIHIAPEKIGESVNLSRV